MKHPLSILVATAAIASFLPSQQTYGSGTAGTGGAIPRLGCPQAWIGNAGFGLDVDQGRGGAVCIAVASLFSTNQTAYGMNILADPAGTIGTYFLALGGTPNAAGAGSGRLPLSLANVPATPSFAGLDFYFQAFVLDPAGPGVGGLSSTNGLTMSLTMPRELAVAAGSTHYRLDGAGNGQAAAAPYSAVVGFAFDNAGLDVYATTSGGTLWHGDLRGAQPAWTALNTNLGTTVAAWDNIAIQAETRWAWIAGRGTGTQMEMIAVDVDPQSSAYGQQIVQTNGLQAAIQPFGAWAMSPDGHLLAAASPWNGSLAVVDTDPNSATFLQIVVATAIPASSFAPGFTVNNAIAWDATGLRVYIARQNQNTNPGEIAVYDLASGWIDHDPSTAFLVDHIGPNSIPAVPLPAGLRNLAIAPDGSRMFAVGSASGSGRALRIDLPSLAYVLPSGTTSLAQADLLAVTPDADVLAVSLPGKIVFYDTATMAETGSYTLGSGVVVGDLGWR